VDRRDPRRIRVASERDERDLDEDRDDERKGEPGELPPFSDQREDRHEDGDRVEQARAERFMDAEIAAEDPDAGEQELEREQDEESGGEVGERIANE
jgi:hypothetical protein